MGKMLSLMAVVQKELLVLLRDRAGLLVLFVMPAVLVVVITLVQENVLKTMGAGDTEILLINQDDGALGSQMADALAAAEGVRVVRPHAHARPPERPGEPVRQARGGSAGHRPRAAHRDPFRSDGHGRLPLGGPPFDGADGSAHRSG